MSEILINNMEVQSFLDDFENRLEFSFEIEQSKKSELLEIAKNKGILIDGSRDLAIFSGTYEVLGIPNGNGKILPLNKEILRKLPQLIGKPINIQHIRRYVVGFICDFRFLEKEKKVLIYGVFFKSIFADEWEKFTKLFKDKKVGLSSEIWSPKSKRNYLSDGSYELRDIEFSGVAIIFIDNKNKPAEEDCLVLETSKKNYDTCQELVYSSLNNENFKDYICKSCTIGGNCGANCENLIVSNQEITAPIQQQPNKIKIICSHCQFNFEYLFIPNQTSSIKCPSCSSILDQTGKVLYPPQILNFSLSCPNDSARNWLILETNENESKIKCQSCAKEYKLTFKEMPKDLKEMLSKIQFLTSGQKACWQCGHYNNYIATSNQEKINLKCEKCGLDYYFIVSQQVKRDIESIEEIGIKKDEKKEDAKMEMVTMEKSAVRKLLRKAVSKLKDTKKQESIEKSSIRKLLRKAVSKINDSKKTLKVKGEESALTKSKLEKFVGGIKKFSGKIKDLKGKNKAQELEISELKKKLEPPVVSVKVEEPELETASLRVGNEPKDDPEGKNKRITKIREQQNRYLNP